jgi:hypothetical protein
MQIPHAEAARTAMIMMLIFAVLGFVILFGIISLINGIYMLKTGRRSTFLMWVMLSMVFALIFGGTVISIFLR